VEQSERDDGYVYQLDTTSTWL